MFGQAIADGSVHPALRRASDELAQTPAERGVTLLMQGLARRVSRPGIGRARRLLATYDHSFGTSRKPNADPDGMR